jgi:hypothetical protein
MTFQDVPGRWRCGGDYPRVSLTSVTGPDGQVVYVYVCNVQVDLDGAPDAYGPPGTHHREPIGNARDTPDPKMKGWYGVYAMTPADALANHVAIDMKPALRDANGKYPVLQDAQQPKPGFYVSQTPSGSGNRAFKPWDQRRYVDATQVAFAALAGKLAGEGFEIGDLCLSLRLDKGVQSVYPYIDAAGAESWALSEVSFKVFDELGGSGFTAHEIAKANGFLACHLAMLESAGSDVGTILAALSKAENPGDLPLLLACQLAARPGGAGLAMLRRYQSASAEQRLKMPLPPAFHAAVAALRSAGYPYLAPGDYAPGSADSA